MEILERLFSMQDVGYQAFQRRLMPTVAPERVIGVRTPQLRRLAKELRGSAGAFLAELPHFYYEENNLHAFLIEGISDYDECLSAVEAFLPHIDNWATCDSLSPRVFGRHTDELLAPIQCWLGSERVYPCRFGIGQLMRWYLDERFSPEYLRMVAAVASEEYYVRMMVAWYFATALAKQYEFTLPYLTEGRLDEWTHRKTIQKAIESDRISAEQKAYLRTLR